MHTTTEMPRRRANAPGPAQEDSAPMQDQSLKPNPEPRRRVKVDRGIWLRDGRYIVGYTDTAGTWRTKTVQAKTLTEARRRREELNVRVRAGHEPVPSKVKLTTVAEDFFETFESLVFAGEKSQRTLDLYRQRWRTHLKQPLGHLNVQQIRLSTSPASCARCARKDSRRGRCKASMCCSVRSSRTPRHAACSSTRHLNDSRRLSGQPANHARSPAH